MQLFLSTSGGRQSLPAHFHFQPGWSPTLAKPAGKQNTGNSKQQGGNLESIAGILKGLKRVYRGSALFVRNNDWDPAHRK